MTYTKADFEDAFPPRLGGKEDEYTTVATPAQLFDFIEDVPALDTSVSIPNNKGVWGPNGNYYYPDCDELLECASAEGIGGREIELHCRVGEHIIDSLAKLEAESRQNSGFDTVLASKRSGYVDVWDSRGKSLLTEMSTGHHEGYYAPVLADSRYALEVNRHHAELSSYLSTRGVWAGVGIVTAGGFRTTQKYDSIDFNEKLKPTTHGRKMPLRRHHDTGRLEVRTGDGQMSSKNAIALYDLTSLVIRMIEHAEFPSALIVVDPNHAIRDSSVRGRLVQTKSGTMSGAEHQRRIAEAAYDFATRRSDGPPKYETAAAEYVAGICGDIELYDGTRGTLELIGDNVEWAAKLLYIRKYIGDKALVTADNIEAVRRDLQWENISPTKSPSRKWHALNGDPFTNAEILRAANKPPHTRALARTGLLLVTESLKSAEWDYVHAVGKEFSLPDPYDAKTVIQTV